MSKKNTAIIICIILLVIIILGIYWFTYSQKNVSNNNQPSPTSAFVLDPKNCAYNIENQAVALVDGYSEQEVAPGSASKTITRYFGNEVSGDFNNDGFSDIAFILTQESGGSGTFYYLAVALGSKDKCIGTNAIFLGDRIAPQSTNFQNGEIIVNYADRNPDEPMTEIPSVGVSKYFKITGNQLLEDVQY